MFEATYSNCIQTQGKKSIRQVKLLASDESIKLASANRYVLSPRKTANSRTLCANSVKRVFHNSEACLINTNQVLIDGSRCCNNFIIIRLFITHAETIVYSKDVRTRWSFYHFDKIVVTYGIEFKFWWKIIPTRSGKNSVVSRINSRWLGNCKYGRKIPRVLLLHHS